MTVIRTIGLRRIAWTLLLVAACRQTDVLRPAASLHEPKQTPGGGQQETPGPQGTDTITVVVLPFGNGCMPAATLCAAAGTTSLTMDGGAPHTFSAAGPIDFPDLAPGKHVLRNISGHYGGPVICGFWFEDESQEITLVLEKGSRITVSLHFECF